MRQNMCVRTVTAALVLVVVTATGAGITGASTAVSPSTVRDAAVDWLVPQVTGQGALVSDYTDAPDPSLTAQAVLGLAASGADPATVAKMIGYLEAHVEEFVAPAGSVDSPGALAWLILDAVVSDTDPTDFGGVDLVARLTATQQPDGRFGAGDPTYDGVFRQGLSLIALSAVGTMNPAGITWLSAQQCADGGFVAFRADPTSPCPAVDATNFVGEDTNSTAAASMALHLAGDDSAADAAIGWLEHVRTAAGGFAYLGDPGLEQDANSTGLVALALRTVRGVDDSSSVAALASLQVPSSGIASDRGGIAFQAGGVLVPDLMATTQAILGLAGQGLPFHPVPPRVTTTTTSSAAPSTPVPTTPRVHTPAPASPVSATPTYTG